MKNNVGLFLAKRAMLSPDLEAIVDPATDRRFTYAELNRRCNRVANALADIGVVEGDRVGIMLMNSSEFVETFFAIAKIGAVVVPLNWRLVPDELEFILKDSGTTVLVFGTEFQTSVDELHSRGDRTDIGRWIRVGGAADAYSLDYPEWTEAAADSEPASVGSDDDLVFIMYTSGTTGLPKGVMHTHATVMWALLTIAATADIRFKDRYLVSLPIFHVGALSPVLAGVYRGSTLVLQRAFDPRVVWQLFTDERITSTLLVPAMLQFMLPAYDAAAHDIGPLRWVMSGAAPVPVTLIKAYEALGVEIHQVYGLTESGGPACLIGPDDALTHAGSTGKAFFHTEVRVIREDGTDCSRRAR